MALTVNQNLITFERLSQYDGLIKTYVDTADAKSIKSISYDSATRKVYFYKTEDASGTAAYDITLPSTSEFIQKLTVVEAGTEGTHAGDFVTVASDGSLTGAGATIAAEKITVADAGNLITATDVEGALQEIAAASAGGVSSKTVYVTETAGASSDAYSKRYGIYQGATGTSTSPVASEKVADIDIPKDMVISDAECRKATAQDVADAGTEPGFAAGDYIIVLTIANNDGTKLYVPVQSLVDVYTPEANAAQIQLAISDNNVISAQIVDGSVGTDALGSKVVTAAKIADNTITETQLDSDVIAKLDKAVGVTAVVEGTANGTVSVTTNGTTADVAVHGLGSAAYADTTDFEAAGAVTTAIQALDSATNDAAVTDAATDSLKVLTKVGIVDGKIANIDTTQLTLATEAQIAGLFPSAE